MKVIKIISSSSAQYIEVAIPYIEGESEEDRLTRYLSLYHPDETDYEFVEFDNARKEITEFQERVRMNAIEISNLQLA